MKREFLKELGIEDKEVIDKIMDENGKDIETAKGKNNDDKVKELQAEVDKLNGQIKERDGQLDELKKSAGDNKELQKQIDDLKDANKAAQEKHDSEMAELKKSSAIRQALSEAKARNIQAVMSLIDTSKVSIDGENTVGLKEQIDKLMTEEDTKFLFESGKTKITGAEPGKSGDGEPDSPKTEIEKRIAKYKK